MARRGVEIPDLREKGGVKDGEQQASDRRLFMQFLAFGDCTDTQALAQALDASKLDVALYEDVNDPRGVGLLVMSEDPPCSGARIPSATNPTWMRRSLTAHDALR